MSLKMFKKLLFSTFLIILISSEISQDVSFLKNFKSSDRLVYITDDYPEKTIDASSLFHRNILFANYHNSINTSLNVNCLNKETSIEVRRLCFSKNFNSEKTCYSIDEIPEDITDEFQLDIKNKTNGFIFKIQKNNINRQNELYGVFSCNIGANEKTMIESLYVQISDPGSKLGKFLPAGHGETEIVNPYSKRDLPLTFECLSDIKDDPVQNPLVLPYKFAYCSITPNVTTVYSCAGSRKAFSPDLGYVNKVGDLVVYNRTLFNDSSIAIVCISRKTVLPIKGYVSSLIHDKKYKSGITINKATLEQEEYIAQSSRSEYFNVLVGEKDFELHASYKEPVGGSTFKWFKEDKEIIDCEDCSQYHYRFKKEITFSDTGYYKLRLTSVEDPEKSLQFTYDINPFGAPFFKESPDMRIGYFLKGKPIQVLFELENEADFKVDVSPSTVKKAMHNSRSDMLNLFLYPNQSSVEKIKINVLASNEYGKSRIERIIKPIENIVPKESLKKYDCFADCMNRTRELVFDVDEEKITKLKEMGIFYEQDWTINQKINLEDLPEDDEIFEYFKYDKEEPGKLMVKPYKDEGLIDNALEKMNFKRKKSIEEVLAERFNNPNLDKVEIEARVKYYLPSKDKDGKSINFYMASPPLNIEPEIKIINNKEYKLLYDSVYSKHREDNSPLKATLQFDKPITQASLGWIAAVVFGIIALLVVLVVCCFYCKKNKNSKSYEPRKSEEKRGLSPDSNFNSNRILQPLIPSETDKVYMTSDVSPKNNDDIEEGDLSFAQWNDEKK